MRIRFLVLVACVFGYLPGVLSAQTPALAAEFQVNTYTTNNQSYPSVASSASGCFIVTWDSVGQDAPPQTGVFLQAYDEFRQALTGEVPVNEFTTGAQQLPTIASSPDCDSVVAWQSAQEGSNDGIYARLFHEDGVPSGSEFAVNAFTTSTQEAPAAAMDASGRFVVVWQSFSEDGAGFGIVGRRFDATGAPLGSDFVVNTTTANNQMYPSVAMTSAGDFVVAWQSLGQDGDQEGIFARRYDASGNAVSGEIAVNTYTTNRQIQPSVALDPSGGFVVAWESVGQDGDADSVFARRFDALNDPVTGELAVNTYTTESQGSPRVAAMPDGGFMVTWQGQGPGQAGIEVWARRFAANDTARDDAFQVNVDTTSGNQSHPTITVDPRGGFAIAWQSLAQDGNGFGIFARQGGFPVANPLAVDTRAASSGTSNLNGIFEPEETVTVDPSWSNTSLLPLTFTATAHVFTGPAGPVYTIDDNSAGYGKVDAGATGDCFDATGNCYQFHVTGARPATHWDATFEERFSAPPPYVRKTWTLHVGQSFADVPTTNQFYAFVETIFHNRVTAGGICGGYCPGDATLRKQMAVFVLKAQEGAFFVPPPAVGIFNDVPASDPFAPWIEELYNRGVVAGCIAPGGPNYCPDDPVLRQQMAVFLLRTQEGSAYVPPPCAGVFDDVPCPGQFTDWIEEIAARGIAAGCGGANYCPDDPTTRGQMAPFLVKTFGLVLYGP